MIQTMRHGSASSTSVCPCHLISDSHLLTNDLCMSCSVRARLRLWDRWPQSWRALRLSRHLVFSPHIHSHVCTQANYSLSGAFSPLSKLIVCAVMLRGRHRGLPVAIDRAVLLPFEFRDNQGNEDRTAPHRRRPSVASVPTISTAHNAGSITEKTNGPSVRSSSRWTLRHRDTAISADNNDNSGNAALES